MTATWRQLDDTRVKMGGLSRAAMARWAGVNESTITKGIERDGSPTPSVRHKVELVLEAAALQAGRPIPHQWELKVDSAGKPVIIDAANDTAIAELLTGNIADHNLIVNAPALLAIVKDLLAHADQRQLDAAALRPARALIEQLSTELAPPG